MFTTKILWIFITSALVRSRTSTMTSSESVQRISMTSQQQQQQQQQPGPTRLCRDRFGAVDVSSFRRRACAMCYSYLFPAASGLVAAGPDFRFLVRVNASGMTYGEPIVADPDVEESVEEVCAGIPGGEVGCWRWTQCCVMAGQCCQRQLEQQQQQQQRQQTAIQSTDQQQTTLNGSDAHHDFLTDDPQSAGVAGSATCVSTWDGFSCWDETEAGREVRQACPAYMDRVIPTQESVKNCDADGRWFAKGGYEWTDYTPCLDKESYITGVYVCVTFNVISIVLLTPATILFCVFRDLYKQDRVRLHIQFFLSLILVNVVSIAWYLLVHHELLSNPNGTESVIYRNPVWCRLISFFKIYLTGSNYFWMFCEGYHLHRLISNAFEAPTSMIGLYVVGWLAPAVFTITYACVRAALLNESCWTKNAGGYQWIIYVPNLLCLVVNLFFLCNILRTLLFQLHAHPHEPNNFRRGLKAGFMLVPLFGIQLLLTIYRPDVGARGERQFEYITFAVTNSQGVFVSLIFCFFNGEVLTHVRRLCPRSRKDNWRISPTSHVTHMTTAGDGLDCSPRPGSANGRAASLVAGNGLSPHRGSRAGSVTWRPSMSLAAGGAAGGARSPGQESMIQLKELSSTGDASNNGKAETQQLTSGYTALHSCCSSSDDGR